MSTSILVYMVTSLIFGTTLDGSPLLQVTEASTIVTIEECLKHAYEVNTNGSSKEIVFCMPKEDPDPTPTPPPVEPNVPSTPPVVNKLI